MKKYTTDEIRNKADTYDPKFIPTDSDEIARKYNINHNIDITTGKENMGGRAWIMWLLDEIDKDDVSPVPPLNHPVETIVEGKK